jgi:outer membrane protein TolC
MVLEWNNRMKDCGMENRAGWAAVLALGTMLCGGPLVAQEPVVRRVSLDEALRLAYLNNPVSVSAQTSVDAAEADRLQAMGAFLPSLNVNGIYTNSSNQRFDQATGRLVSTSYQAQTQAGYDLFTAGRRLMSYRSANARLDAADASLREARFQTSLTTTSIFYEAAAAAELVGVSEQRLARAKQQLSFANTRLEVETATRSDVLRAEIEVGNAELALIDAQSALRTARLELGRQIGMGGEAEPADARLPEEPPVLEPADSLAARAARTSPMALSADAEWTESRTGKLSSYTFYVPSLRLTGGYDWFSATYPPRSRSWSLRLTASLPVFNGFQREAAISRAAAEERLAAARARDAVIAARAQAIDAAQRIESAGRRVSIARRSVELAREDLRVQEERYQIGAATIVELQTSQVSLAEAESAFVRARQQLGVAVAQLEAVLGERLPAN